MERFTGRVAWFNNGKGFELIKSISGPDILCHFSSLEADSLKPLHAGDVVEFNIVQGETGRPLTEHVTRVAEQRPS